MIDTNYSAIADRFPDSLGRLCILRNVLSYFRLGWAAALGQSSEWRALLSDEGDWTEREQSDARDVRAKVRRMTEMIKKIRI